MYLIFEFLTMDLKQYMDTQCGSKDQPMQPQLVKSWIYQLCQVGLRCRDCLHCLIDKIFNGVNTGHRVLSLEEGVA